MHEQAIHGTHSNWIEDAETELMVALYKSYDHSDFYPSFGVVDYFLFGDFYAQIRLDPGVIMRLVTHPDPTVRRWALDYPGLTPEQMAELIRSDQATHMLLALKPALPPECLRMLYDRQSQLGLIAGHPNTPSEILETLAATLEAGVFTSHPCLPRKVLETLFARCGENPSLLFALAGQPQLPAELALHLIRNCTIPALRGEIASSLPGPRAAFELLAADPEDRVRAALARNRKLPADLALRLAADPAESVRQAAAKLLQAWQTLPKAPGQSENPRFKYSDVRNWWAFETDLKPHLFFRLLALLHDTYDDAQMQAESARASAWQERYAVARHLCCPAELLQELSQDPEPPVAKMALLRKASLPGLG